MSKDWIGNKKSTYTTLGASNHSDHDRAERDYYATDPIVIEPLLKQLEKNGEYLSKDIWENAAGDGHLSKELTKFGYNVFSSDIIKRSFECDIIDFLLVNEPIEKNIITNPPYFIAYEFLENAMDNIKEGLFVIMFLKLTFLEGQKRKKLFEKYPPKYVYVFSQRKKCAMNGDFEHTGSSAACYAWFVWQKGYAGKPQIEWI